MEGVPSPGSSLTVSLVILIASLILVAFLAISEANLISVNRTRVSHLAERGNKSAQAIMRLVNDEENLLATLTVAQDLFIIFLGTATAISLIDERGVLVTTVLMTLAVVVFGQMLPRIVSLQHHERFALLVARPLELAVRPMRPLPALLASICKMAAPSVERRNDHAPSVTDRELRTLVDNGNAEGTVRAAAADMIEKVFDFGWRTVREVMVPRPEIVEVKKGARLSGFLTVYLEAPHSRYPVFEESIDNIIGILSVGGIFTAYARGELNEQDPVERFVSPAYHIPETKRIFDLLNEMRETGNRMGIVIDEFGGTAGLVTLGQLVEEMVGHMETDSGHPGKEIRTVHGSTCYVDGSMRIQEANEELRLGLPEGGYVTVAGFIISELGRMPREGDQLARGNLTLKVVEMRGLRIERVLVTRT